MAIKQETWDIAEALYKAGKTDDEIYIETKVKRSALARKAKREGWEKATNAKIINNEISLLREKATLNATELLVHDKEVKIKAEFYRELDTFTKKTMTKAVALMGTVDNGTEFKAIIEGVDKHSLTVGVNERHSKPVQVNQSNQTLVNITDDQLDAKIGALTS